MLFQASYADIARHAAALYTQQVSIYFYNSPLLYILILEERKRIETFFFIRPVSSRPQSTGRLCSVARRLRRAVGTTRSRCPAPRATPSPSTTPLLLLIQDQTSTTPTLLQGLRASLQTRIGRPCPLPRGHLYLLLRGRLCLPPLLVISFSRPPPQR